MNILLISLDSLRADAVSFYGSDWVRTPNLDRLAEESLVFETAIVQTPHTIPSHASMLTGLYPFNHGLRKDSGRRMAPAARTVFGRLRSNGYRTAAFQGNYVLGQEYGYSDWNRKGPPKPEAIGDCLEEFGDDRFFVFIHTYDLHVPYCTVVPPASSRDDVINSLLMHERLTGRRLPPSFRNRHIPSGGEDWLRRINAVVDMLASGGERGFEEVRRGYAQAVEQIDRWFGQVFSLLERFGVWDNTIVIVTADHGDCFNEHGEMHENPHWSSVHGAFLYDDVLRVPLMMRTPGQSHGRGRVSSPVESVDIAPTIYELLEIQTDASDAEALSPDGVSLLQAVNGKPKTYTYSETLIRENHKVCLRSTQSKLIVDIASGRRQLFDLATDIEEQRDLSQEGPLLTGEMEAELHRFVDTHQKETVEALMTPGETAVVAERLRGLGYVD